MTEAREEKLKKLRTKNPHEEPQFQQSFQKKTEDVKALNILIPTELHNKLKKLSIDRGEPMREIVAQWIENA